jgi:hypothetical protein
VKPIVSAGTGGPFWRRREGGGGTSLAERGGETGLARHLLALKSRLSGLSAASNQTRVRETAEVFPLARAAQAVSRSVSTALPAGHRDAQCDAGEHSGRRLGWFGPPLLPCRDRGARRAGQLLPWFVPHNYLAVPCQPCAEQRLDANRSRSPRVSPTPPAHACGGCTNSGSDRIGPTAVTSAPRREPICTAPTQTALITP